MREFKKIRGIFVKDETARNMAENVQQNLNIEKQQRQSALQAESTAREKAINDAKKEFENNHAELAGALADEINERTNDMLLMDTKHKQLLADEEKARRAMGTSLTGMIATGFDALEADETEMVKVHFPYRSHDAGDCSIIEAYGKTILIDVGTADSITQLINYLTATGLTKIDHIIITHFHHDHVGNASNVLTLLDSAIIDTTDTVFYLPHGKMNWNDCLNADGYYDEIRGYETAILNKLSQTGNTYIRPEEGDTLEIENCVFKFLNLKESDFEVYYGCQMKHNYDIDAVTRYNNFSMVVEMLHKNHVFLFAGDIEEMAESKLADRINVPDVLKMQHHGCNYGVHKSFAMKLAPKYTVICDYDTNDFDTLYRSAYSVVRNCSDVFSTNVSGNVVIASTKNHLKAISEHGRINFDDVALLTGGKGIPEGTDLDTMLTVGHYFSQSSARTDTLLNVPEYGSGFDLEVKHLNPTGTAKEQILTVSSRRSCNKYTRSYYNGTWYPWTSMTPYSEGIKLAEGDDLDDCLLRCDYVCESSAVCKILENVPSDLSAGFKLINHYISATTLKQIIYPNDYDEQFFYTRTISGGDNANSGWFKFTGTAV